jgi:hypothetical protein
MKKLSPLQQTYLEVAKIFHFATRDHFALWFTGTTGRHKQTERILPSLVKKGELRAIQYGKRLIYATPERFKFIKAAAAYQTCEKKLVAIFPHHGLCCTEILIRVILADKKCEVVSEKAFRHYGWGCVPEWGIRYPNGKALLLEFCTESNVYARGNLSSKITRYEKNLWKLSLGLEAEPVVLFVLDIPRPEIEMLVKTSNLGTDPFFFVDYASFQNVPTKKQLTAPIYLWGGNGKTYPLKENVGLEII